MVIVDQMSGLETTGTPLEIKSAMMRLIDFLKLKGITAMYTDLTMDGNPVALTRHRNLFPGGHVADLARSRTQRRAQPRPPHHQIARHGTFESGPRIHHERTRYRAERHLYGPSGMLTGSARVAQEALERAQQVRRHEEVERQQLELKRKHDALEGQIAALRAEFAAEEARIERSISYDKQHEESLVLDVVEMKRSRKHDEVKTSRNLGSRNGGKL